jgi:methionyl aminopeptidase
MIKLRTPEEIVLIKTACNALSEWMEQCVVNLEIGSTYQNGQDIAKELNTYLAHLIYKDHNKIWDTPFFWQRNKDGKEFASPLCISINDEIVHSRPTDKKFKTGDIITLDAGLSCDGWCADMARTVAFGAGPDMDGIKEFHYILINICRAALYKAYDQCKPGNTLKDVSTAIYTTANKHNLGTVIDYMGHGIGKNLHEEPRIPNIPELFPHYDSIILRPGMVFCLEPMFTLGKGYTTLAPDKWRVWTQDGSMAAHFESQILITEEGCEVLTKLAGEYPWEEQ